MCRLLFNPLYTNGFIHLVLYIKLRIVHCIFLGMSGYDFEKNIVFFCLETHFTITNSVDPDEMQHDAAFHLGLHCLQKYSFRSFPEYKEFTHWNTHNSPSAITVCLSVSFKLFLSRLFVNKNALYVCLTIISPLTLFITCCYSGARWLSG